MEGVIQKNIKYGKYYSAVSRDEKYENKMLPESMWTNKEGYSQSYPRKIVKTVELYKNQKVGEF